MALYVECRIYKNALLQTVFHLKNCFSLSFSSTTIEIALLNPRHLPERPILLLTIRAIGS